MRLSAEAMSSLSDLSKLSKSLNDESNKVNEVLLDFEEKLVAMNLGVEAWVTLTEEPYTEELQEGDDRQVKCLKETELGFGEYCGSYQLLIRYLDYVEDVTQYGNPRWEKREEYGKSPIRAVSRQVRVSALENLEKLLDALMVEANRVLKAIERGRKVVDNLKTK